jgi:hypothetical protein
MLVEKNRNSQQLGYTSSALKILSQKKLLWVTGFLLGTVVLAACFVLAVYVKGWSSAQHFSEVHKETMRRKIPFLLLPQIWVKSLLSPAEAIPKLYIDIKFQGVQKILRQKEAARKANKIVQGSDDWVPAHVSYNDSKIKVKLRLKGDTLAHMHGDKSSFRIHTKGKKSLFGMRRFSIQNPSTRNYESEILFYRALQREGIMVPRYFFVNVTINGKDIGIMALEEHMSKELLESQGRKEAPIIRFDDEVFFDAYQTPFFRLFGSHKAMPVKTIGGNPKKKSAVFQSYLQTATGLLRGFTQGEIAPSKVFDPVMTGRYLAVAKVWGAAHSLAPDDARFYYNPITAKLEMIGHDGSLSFEPLTQDAPLARQLLAAQKIKSVYSETLQRIDREFQEGVTMKWAQEVQDKNVSTLQQEFYAVEKFNLNEVKRRASMAHKLDQGLFNNYPDYLNVYYMDGIDQRGVLEMTNRLPNPVNVTSIKIVNRLTGAEIPVSSDLFKTVPFLLKGTPYASNPKIIRIVLDKIYDFKKYGIRVHSNIKGGSQSMVHEAISYYPSLKLSPIPDRSISQVLSDFPFVTQAKPNTLRIEQGEWNVDSWLFVPKGFKLIIPEGTILRFSSSTGIIARGPVIMNGANDNPVVLEGEGQKESQGQWQGIFVSDTKEPSVWSNVVIRNTSGISTKGWGLTAGTTFYQADAILKNVSFLGNRCEDSLNIVRSKFEISGISIKNALSDGFDSDFSNGIVTKGKFENIGLAGGGDGIDVSGTTINIRETMFKNIGDKAISAGEKSTVTGTQLHIEGAGAGVVSKDGSHVSLENSTIRDYNIAAMMVYIKKQEYGPATILANHIEADNLPVSAIAQKGSHILIDGIEVPSRDLNVKRLYAAQMKPALKK